MYSYEEIDSVNNFEYGRLINLIIKHGRMMKYETGNILYYFNDEANGLYYIKSGKITGKYFDENGEEQTAFIITEGFLAGEDAFTTPAKRVVSAGVAAPTVLYYIDRNTLMDLCMNDREAMRQLLGMFTRKMVFFLNALNSAQQRKAKSKVAMYILQMNIMSPGNIELTHDSLAEVVGISRVKVSSILGELEEAGYIKTKYKKIEILDRKGLLSFIE